MRKVTFVAPCTDGDEVVTGWELASGAVVHRMLLRSGPSDDAWSVSDPVSGASFTRGGSTMGAAVARYRQIVAGFGAEWPRVLARQQRMVRDQVLAWRRRAELPACALLEAPETVQ